MATQVITNHHHVSFNPNGQTAPPQVTTSYHSGSRFSIEHDNPFRPGSELIEEAEEILKNITIVGNNVVIPPANNDSGLGATTTPRTANQSPSAAANGSAIQAHEVTPLQCSTILSSTTASAHDETSPENVVQRASPQSLQPDSPARAEHVVVEKEKVTPIPVDVVDDSGNNNPFNDPKLRQQVQKDIDQSKASEGDNKKKSKKKKKKGCSIL